jgi:hypothetical protein
MEPILSRLPRLTNNGGSDGQDEEEQSRCYAGLAHRRTTASGGLYSAPPDDIQSII